MKANNVLINKATSSCPNCQYNIVLTDFGNATDATKGGKYTHPSLKEPQFFEKMNPHLPPEVRSGNLPLSRASDIYAYGKFLNKYFAVPNNKLCMGSIVENLTGSK